MGLNAFFAFSVVLGMGIKWEAALSGVFVSGLIFVALSLQVSVKIINAIPAELKLAVGAGIGLFITFVGLQGLALLNNDNTLVSIGNIHSGPVLLTVFGIVVTVILMGSSSECRCLHWDACDSYCWYDLWSCASTISNCGKYSKLVPNLWSGLDSLARNFLDSNACRDFNVPIRWVLDTAGTLVAVATQAGLMKNNELPRAGRALLADSSSIVVGSVLGTSTATSYVESSSGVAAGARSGFAAVVTGIFFLLAMFFSPLLSIVTSNVTAPALIIVGALMVAPLAKMHGIV